MKLATGNMFYHPADLILVTTNSYVRSTNSTLVMGRGAAAELRRYLPEAESVFGSMVQRIEPIGFSIWKRYGVLVAPVSYHQLNDKPRYGIFQVKYHWGKPAVLELIQYSVKRLTEIAPQYKNISLNFPGIGNGGLDRETVLPWIQDLPGNCTVWELG